jgi:hypothetical protein
MRKTLVDMEIILLTRKNTRRSHYDIKKTLVDMEIILFDKVKMLF